MPGVHVGMLLRISQAEQGPFHEESVRHAVVFEYNKLPASGIFEERSQRASNDDVCIEDHHELSQDA